MLILLDLIKIGFGQRKSIGDDLNIKFIASSKHVLEVRDRPIPASQLLPTWWKNMDTFATGKFDMIPYPTTTAKKCFPLLDSMTSGYILTLWSDLFVSKDYNGNQVVKWAVMEPVVDAWTPMQLSSYEIPEGFSKTVYKYYHGWIIETPKNYSCLVTHPFGYQNLPIKTITGVIDTDELKTHANAPFVIKEDFEGIIPKGTPMAQIIPFKRDNWKMEIDLITDEESRFRYDRLYSTIKSSYGINLRSKKEYR
jgi:hypothetical protein